MSTKIHQLVDGNGLPLVALITPGPAGDSPMFLRRYGHLKQWRGLATSYDKLAVVYPATVILNAVIAWTRHVSGML